MDLNDARMLPSVAGCRSARATLYTHALAKNIVWNLGNNAMVGESSSKNLVGPAKPFWREFEKEKAKAILEEALRFESMSEELEITEQPKYRLLGAPPVKKR